MEPRRTAVIIGSGPCGSVSALALARQGWSVYVVDRDASVDTSLRTSVNTAATPDVEAWSRSGVAQFHQPHAFLARLWSELAQGLPDVLEQVIAAGAVPVQLPADMEAAWCRRSTLEAVLHRAVAAQHGITSIEDAAEVVEHVGGRVRGVRLRSGASLAADLVVDAGGRRGKLTRPWVGEDVDLPSEEVYTSRRYRMRPGATMPPVNRGVIAVAESDGYAALVFPHDAGTFTTCLTRLPEDDDLAELRHPDVYEAAVAAIAMTATWTDPERSEPLGGVKVMAGLRNTFRTLREDAPLGLVAAGDVVSTSNPHFGRGTAMAVAAGLRLAEGVAADPDEPRTWRERMTDWEQGEIRGWFDDGNELDAGRAGMWRAALAGGAPGGAPGGRSGPPAGPSGPPAGPPPGRGRRLPTGLVLATGGADPRIGRAVLRHMQMADPPSALDAVRPLAQEVLASGWRPGRDGEVAPPRAELVEVLKASRGAALAAV